MSHLEAQLVENTAAIKELTAAIISSNADRKVVLEHLATGAAAAPATARKPRGRPAAEIHTEEVAAAVPAAAEVAHPEAGAVRAAASAFLDTTDEAVRTERKLFVKAVIDHLGATTVLEIPAADRAKAIAWFAAKGAGQKVSFDNGEEAPEDDMLG
jgi:hypothetical protein